MDAVPRRSPDVYLFAATVALIGIGIVMIYSASAIVALDWFGDSAFFLKRQLLWSVLGLGVMSVSLTIHYQRLRRITPALLLLVAVALVAVLIPGIGRLGGGARRWVGVGAGDLRAGGSGNPLSGPQPANLSDYRRRGGPSVPQAAAAAARHGRA